MFEIFFLMFSFCCIDFSNEKQLLNKNLEKLKIFFPREILYEVR